MRTEWLEYFSDVARLGSIKASAAKHCISPQGLSKSIRSLEGELGVKLFERDANSVRLTPEGSHLLEQARIVVEASRELTRQAHDISTGAAATPLSIMCSAFVFMCGLMDPLREGVALTGRTATFMQMHTDEILQALLNKTSPLHEGKVLCGLTLLFSPLKAKNEQRLLKVALNGYTYQPLIRYGDGALVSSKHPLASSERATRADLLRYPVISSSVEQLEPLTSYLGADHIASAIADVATRLRAIQDNKSVIFMPPFSEIADDPRYCFLPIEDGYEVELGFVYDRNEMGPDETTPLLERLAAHFDSFEESGLCTISVVH